MRLERIKTLLIFMLLTCFYQTSYAQDKYTFCSENEIQSITQKHRLNIDLDNFDYEFKSFAYIHLNQNSQPPTIFTYLSNGFKHANDEYDQNLNILLLDKNQKILSQTTIQNYIEYGGFDNDGIRIENVPFSTIDNNLVFGITRSETKRGDLGFRAYYLSLFQITESLKFKQVLKDFPSYAYEYLTYAKCNKGTTSKITRTIHLDNRVHAGLHDLVIKEKKINHATEYKSCKSKSYQLKKQQYLKFDGQQYRFNEAHFLQRDGI